MSESQFDIDFALDQLRTFRATASRAETILDTVRDRCEREGAPDDLLRAIEGALDAITVLQHRDRQIQHAMDRVLGVGDLQYVEDAESVEEYVRICDLAIDMNLALADHVKYEQSQHP